MTYIGNQPANSYTSFDSQSLTGNGTAGPYTLSASVSSANEIEVFVNFVRQRPGVAYTVAGNQLTMTGNVESTDDFYVVYQGKAVQTVVPPDGSVTTATINDGAVTNAKIDTMAASKLTGALPAIDGSSLTGLTSGFTFPAAQTLNGLSERVFTGIPSGVTVIKFGVWRFSGTTSTSRFMIQLGDSGGIETTGYYWGDHYFLNSTNHSNADNDAAWKLGSWTGASNVIMVQGEIFNVHGNKWLLDANAIYVQDTGYYLHMHGFKELSGELTQIQFAIQSGTFDDTGYVRIGYT